jgi:hypothetical protein
MTNRAEFKRKFIKPSNETAEKIIFGLFPDDAKPFNADIDSMDSSIEITYCSPLACEIGVWLFNNQHLPPLERVGKIREMLMSLSKDELLDHAVGMSETLDATVRLADQAMAAAGNIFSTVDAVHSHARGLAASNANKVRGEKFQTIEQALKQYWLDNIDRNKRATDAAILLEKMDIFGQSSAEPKPKRSTIENYVRKWKKEN